MLNLVLLKWEDDWNMIEMITAAILAIWMFALNFLICELGQWIANQYAAFSDELCKCKWYFLPIEMKRIYLIFLLDTQHPERIKSYGGIVCSRETLKWVSLSRNQFLCMKLLVLFWIFLSILNFRQLTKPFHISWYFAECDRHKSWVWTILY